MDKRKLVDAVSRELLDRGLLIEAGWVGLRKFVIPADAPQVQLDEMRMAFFAGAQHLFGSIMSILEEDREPTEADARRMDQIHKELEAFAAELTKKIEKPAEH